MPIIKQKQAHSEYTRSVQINQVNQINQKCIMYCSVEHHQGPAAVKPASRLQALPPNSDQRPGIVVNLQCREIKRIGN